MVEFPHPHKLVQPVRIHSHPTDPNLRGLQDVAQGMNRRSPARWHHVGISRSVGETGSGHVRVSPIDSSLKSSYGYYWCLGVAGFGRHREQEISFLSHGQDNPQEQERAIRDATRRLLDMCGIEICDFVIFGGQNNLPGEDTLHTSHEVQSILAETIMDETQRRIRSIIISPAPCDTRLTDTMGKSVLVDTPSRTLHVFERLRLDGDQTKQADYVPPEIRAARYEISV